ncbi:hypothetical protein BC827DRAFT_254830 [Russula dissimulans]|nr:hypothetical protein BC827DRAFT_254830 [Russula dissimulans]
MPIGAALKRRHEEILEPLDGVNDTHGHYYRGVRFCGRRRVGISYVTYRSGRFEVSKCQLGRGPHRQHGSRHDRLQCLVADSTAQKWYRIRVRSKGKETHDTTRARHPYNDGWGNVAVRSNMSCECFFAESSTRWSWPEPKRIHFARKCIGQRIID